jgi:hypothetical protein
MCYTLSNKQGEDKMRISNNPLHNSYYARYEKNTGMKVILIAIFTWPFWVFPVLIGIGSFLK